MFEINNISSLLGAKIMFVVVEVMALLLVVDMHESEAAEEV